ncbi:MAG: ABC transporter permease, partial [Verrucomicrobiaceae bacterium]
MKRFATAFLFFAALIAVWHFAVKFRIGNMNPMMTPDPLSVWHYLVDAAQSGDLFAAIWVTVRRLLTGYVIG